MAPSQQIMTGVSKLVFAVLIVGAIMPEFALADNAALAAAVNNHTVGSSSVRRARMEAGGWTFSSTEGVTYMSTLGECSADAGFNFFATLNAVGTMTSAPLEVGGCGTIVIKNCWPSGPPVTVQVGPTGGPFQSYNTSPPNNVYQSINFNFAANDVIKISDGASGTIVQIDTLTFGCAPTTAPTASPTTSSPTMSPTTSPTASGKSKSGKSATKGSSKKGSPKNGQPKKASKISMMPAVTSSTATISTVVIASIVAVAIVAVASVVVKRRMRRSAARPAETIMNGANEEEPTQPVV